MSDDLTAPGGLQGWLDLFQESTFSNLDTAAIYISLFSPQRKAALIIFLSIFNRSTRCPRLCLPAVGSRPSHWLQLPVKANALNCCLCFWLLTFRHLRSDFPLTWASHCHSHRCRMTAVQCHSIFCSWGADGSECMCWKAIGFLKFRGRAGTPLPLVYQMNRIPRFT